MNKALLAVSAAVLILVGMAIGSVPHSTAQAQGSAVNRTISVSGSADVRVVPDEVVLSVGVETWDNVLAAAKTDNDDRTKKVIALATQYQIDPKNVQTDFINISPRYEGDYPYRKIVGYYVQRAIVFTLKDISKFEGLLSAVIESGGNAVYGIQFRTSELRKHRDSARALATQAAREKAEALAKELGMKVGKAIHISETQSYWGSFYGYYRSYGGPSPAQNVVQNAGGEGPQSSDGTFAPGQIVVSGTVSVTFELE